MKHSYLVAAATLILASCSGSNQWNVKGTIAGADGKTMILEASDNGRWYPLDSVTLDADGRFSIKHEAAGYPDIYRLRIDDQSLYFPIDSIETVTVTADNAKLLAGYTLEGSTSAQMLSDVEHKIADLVAKKGVDAAVTDSLFKRELGGMIVGDPAGIVTFYIVSKQVDGKPLFDPTNRNDRRIIGAVANAFDHFRPNDPRTQYLRTLYLSNMPRHASVATDTLYAKEAAIFDINLMDEKGKHQSLAALAKQGKVVVLNFTVYDADQSPAFNRELAKIYNQYKASGLEIYQVSVDPDEFKWRQSAKNLPWITVYNSSVDGSQALIRYNVTDIPTTFIINRKGELVERVDDVSKLQAAVGKYI